MGVFPVLETRWCDTTSRNTGTETWPYQTVGGGQSYFDIGFHDDAELSRNICRVCSRPEHDRHSGGGKMHERRLSTRSVGKGSQILDRVDLPVGVPNAVENHSPH
jgi:hypothetical protein